GARGHGQPDVCGVLAADGLLRHLDQLDRGLVERALVVRVAAPVGVRLLAEHLALLEQPLQHEVDVELAVVGVADADGDVLEIDEKGEPLLVLCVDSQTSSCRSVLPLPISTLGFRAGRPGRPGPRGCGKVNTSVPWAERTGNDYTVRYVKKE